MALVARSCLFMRFHSTLFITFAIVVAGDDVDERFPAANIDDLLDQYSHCTHSALLFTLTSTHRSVGLGFLLGMGVVSGKLVTVIGVRSTVFIGIACFIVALIVSSFMTNIWAMFITYGALTGAGCSLCNLAVLIGVGKHFKKRLSLATGITLSGSGAGTVILAQAITAMIDKFVHCSCFRCMK